MALEKNFDPVILLAEGQSEPADEIVDDAYVTLRLVLPDGALLLQSLDMGELPFGIRLLEMAFAGLGFDELNFCRGQRLAVIVEHGQGKGKVALRSLRHCKIGG